jgi:hypothetical protein
VLLDHWIVVLLETQVVWVTTKLLSLVLALVLQIRSREDVAMLMALHLRELTDTFLEHTRARALPSALDEETEVQEKGAAVEEAEVVVGVGVARREVTDLAREMVALKRHKRIWMLRWKATGPRLTVTLVRKSLEVERLLLLLVTSTWRWPSSYMTV